MAAPEWRTSKSIFEVTRPSPASATMPELLSEGARRLRRNIGAMLVAVSLCAAAFGAGTAAAKTTPPPCRGANLSPSAFNAASVDAATLCLIDQVRVAYHLRPLQFNRELRALATGQVDDMVSWNYFADYRPARAVATVAVGRDALPVAHQERLRRSEHRLGARASTHPPPRWSPRGWPRPNTAGSSSPGNIATPASVSQPRCHRCSDRNSPARPTRSSSPPAGSKSASSPSGAARGHLRRRPPRRDQRPRRSPAPASP